ncbi:DNA-3-methyladenine glycosylase 2 family protein [Gordonia sp. TBRC 11910]|uniref:DNA-3-methyladenine glycosylase II n=1 Tax=Gordonia asplenii TaxID=2725283 RepID=A0A848L003_9ACTN|nr:AlkA N-terminal domain-containing protein [Gordonia asplenii]NMO01791.1 DNA-3-methyladenine glycosylase 2 family protein [Gordonia asplenii]
MVTAITAPSLDFDRCYGALKARDARFDGQFFVTVASTGIYCRPSCPAQTPLARNVGFVLTAAAAQRGGFRACRRCAPDAVPGSPRWNTSADLASRAMKLIADGVVERAGVDGLASRLGYSTRQLSRVLTAELGAGPLALARAHRATNARVLIQCTTMPMTDVAFAAGFASIRQFNDTIREVFALSPTQLRELRASRAHGASTSANGSSITVKLPYRRPFDAAWLRWFLSAHTIPGVAEMIDDEFVRSLELPHGPALIAIGIVDDDPAVKTGSVVLRLRHLDMRDLGVAVQRVRRFLDLDADAQAADEWLSSDPALTPLVAAAAGIRVPGSLDPVETLFTTMIGQQISVSAARTHLGNLATELGARAPWDDADGPTLLFPSAAAIAECGGSVLRGPRRRIDAVVGAAEKISSGSMELHTGLRASDMRGLLRSLPGVGDWTANYVSMRVASDPDVLLGTDLVVVRAAQQLNIDLSQNIKWAPWRSYASMHLWRAAILGVPEESSIIRSADAADIRKGTLHV